MGIFGRTMKKFVKISLIVFVLGVIASCAKEDIVPAAQQNENFSKKGTAATQEDLGNGEHNSDSSEDVVGDGDITDPENDLDFD